MKNLAILFLIATVLPSVWTRSHKEADDILVERGDDLDITSLSEDELKQFVDEARESLKRAAEELFDDEAVQSQTPDKRQRLPPSPKFPVPKFNFKPPPPVPKIPFKTNFNLGKGFKLGTNGLSFQRGNFRANLKPTFSFGKSGLKFTGGQFRIGYRFG
ncbi:uncharacterized protein LOC121381924 [Gigantopelta aegis]|uniref:uncharacterized protein LOC121381924 n=1 Tax=Gigantopelta aegis TaxID=1735272 RepID=UPI001B889F7E|nr:uncharacterized protein LOC121381924 [Gigantopelta aegis]